MLFLGIMFASFAAYAEVEIPQVYMTADDAEVISQKLDVVLSENRSFRESYNKDKKELTTWRKGVDSTLKVQTLQNNATMSVATKGLTETKILRGEVDSTRLDSTRYFVGSVGCFLIGIIFLVWYIKTKAAEPIRRPLHR